MKLKIDMTNVQDGFSLLPEGDYFCKITGVTKEEGTKAPYLKWELTVGTGPEKGKKKNYNTTLSPNALFVLRDFLLACGVEVPKSTISVDTDAIKGKVIGATIVHGTYKDKEGKVKDTDNISEVWKAVKGETGWKRATATTKKAAETTPAKDEDEDDDDAPFDVNEVSSEEIEEIEI